jgi:hypothetical protein
MKTPAETKTEATKAEPPKADSPEDLPWLQACSPTATKQPKRSEKTVLKQFAFIGNSSSTSADPVHGQPERLEIKTNLLTQCALSILVKNFQYCLLYCEFYRQSTS